MKLEETLGLSEDVQFRFALRKPYHSFYPTADHILLKPAARVLLRGSLKHFPLLHRSPRLPQVVPLQRTRALVSYSSHIITFSLSISLALYRYHICIASIGAKTVATVIRRRRGGSLNGD